MGKEQIQAYSRDICPVVKSIQELGDKWILLILRECFFGVKKFDDFQSNLNISRSVLTKKLSQMLENNLLEKSEYQKNNQRVRNEYLLTEKGKELLPLVASLIDWGNKYKVENGQETIELVGRSYANTVNLKLENQLGEQLDFSKVTIKKIKKAST